jgi:hypothetical protein
MSVSETEEDEPASNMTLCSTHLRFYFIGEGCRHCACEAADRTQQMRKEAV